MHFSVVLFLLKLNSAGEGTKILICYLKGGAPPYASKIIVRY